MDGAGAGGRDLDVEALDQALDPEVAGLGRDQDQRVRALVGQDLRRHRGRDRGGVERDLTLAAVEVTHASVAALPDPEDLGQLLLQRHRVGVLDLDRVDALAGARLIELLGERDHVADVGAVVGDDDDAGAGDRLDGADRRLHHRERVGQLLGRDVLRAQDEADDVVGVGGRALAEDRHRLALGVAGLDHAEDVALGHHRQAHRRQADQEQAVGLLGAHLVGRDDRELLRALEDARLVDEVLAGEAHRPAQQVLELGLGLEGDRDRAAGLAAAVELSVLAGHGVAAGGLGLGGPRGQRQQHGGRGDRGQGTERRTT